MIAFRTQGIPQLLRALKDFPPAVESRVIGASLAAQARVVRDIARRTTAITDRSGALRGSIRGGLGRARRRHPRGRGAALRSATTVTGIGGVGYVRAGGRGAAHAPLIELGTQFVAPRRFLRKSLESGRGAAYAAGAKVFRSKFAMVARQIAARTRAGRRLVR